MTASPAGAVDGRTLLFVNTRGDVGDAQPATDVVILDTSWTPGPGERSDLIPVRTAIQHVLLEKNLFEEARLRLDAWADNADLGERFMLDGVTYWYHARGFIRWNLHELLLWRYVLDYLAPPGRYRAIHVPGMRPDLLAAARAPSHSGPATDVVSVGGSLDLASAAAGSTPIGGAPLARKPLIPRIVRGILRRISLRNAWRRRLLAQRASRLIAQRPTVLVTVRGSSFHMVQTEAGSQRRDPVVTPVLERLAASGTAAMSIGIGLRQGIAHDWDLLTKDPRLLPLSSLRGGSSGLPASVLDRHAIEAPLAGIPDVPIDVDGHDLGPALTTTVANLGDWLGQQRDQMTAAERVLAALRPRVLFTGWEGSRTGWLAAAERLGIPTLAIQHGVVYPGTPTYCRPWIPGLVRPTVQCVFGSYERDLLIENGYDPAAVVVTGSPRIDAARALAPDRPEEREAVRSTLGVAASGRILLVSASRHFIGDEVHSIGMVARVLDGPLPGIHVVVKLHPEEASGRHYEALFAGLALAGGYEAPRLTVIRDHDIYSLLRASDAHLGLYSTVLTDAVLAGTPNMISVGQAYSDLIGYVPAGVATPVRSIEDVRAFMADPRPPSPDARARFIESHYASGDAIEIIASAIGRLARREMGGRVDDGPRQQ